jgi:hypothetical protein
MTLQSIRSLTLSQWSDLMTGDNVMRPRSTSDGACKGILDELKAINLGLVEVAVESYSSRVWNGLWK